MKRYIKSVATSLLDEPLDIQLEFARTSSDVNQLEQLIDSRAVIKCEVAKNPNLTEDLIRDLYSSGGFRVEESLVENPSTPADVLSNIAETPKTPEIVLRHIAEHPNTSPDTLKQLADSQYWVVRVKVAKRADTPIEVLQELSKDIEIPVKSVARRTLKSLNANS